MPAILQAATWQRTIGWNTSLSSRQRVLLHAQPILMMRQYWASRDDQDARYDPLCLSMKLFDVVIDQSGFGNEVGRQMVGDEVLSNAAKVFATVDRPLRLSELLAGLQDDGCPVAVQDAVTLEMLDHFDPEEDETELLQFHVRVAEAGSLDALRCFGDDLWIEPLESDT
jgi:hypothetical protein